MGRKDCKPDNNEAIVPYVADSFASGVIKGQVASKIPGDAIADAYDVVVYSDEIRGRKGCTLHTSVVVPALDDRTGYTASKLGGIITANTDTFTESDVGNYFVFPGSPDSHYQISEYVSSSQVRTTNTSDNHSNTSGCYLTGKTNLSEWHKVQRKLIFMWGSQVYVADIELTSLTRCYVISRDFPNNSVSGYSDFDEKSGLIFNSNGIFRIDFGLNPPVVYKINIPIPNIVIPDIVETTASEYNYHYLYSGMRLFGDANGVSRFTAQRIELETGVNTWDASYRDYSDIYTDEPIGPESDTYGVLTCGNLQSPHDNIGGWTALTTNGSFKININDIGINEIVVDFTNVTNMAEVASIIQSGLRDFFVDATCEYDSGRLVITSGRVDDGSVTYITAGTASGTTDISSYMRGTEANGARITTPYTKRNQVVGPLYVSVVENTSPQEYQWHLTHFPIYRTKDLLGRYKIETEADQFNNPNDFVWTYDLRTCGAFLGYISGAYFTAEDGDFEEADVGSTLELESGARYEIMEYISSSTVRVSLILYISDSDNTVAAAIGNGRVFRASQSGNLVTRIDGSTFSSADVRKSMKWADGTWEYIIEYISASQVRVGSSQTRSETGMTMDPVYRYFNDNVADETLETRLTRLKLKQRFWQSMPNSNIGVVTPGLVFVFVDGKMIYGQTPDTLEYLHGFYDAGYQVTKKIKDDIQFAWLFQGVLVIWTTRKTWRWPTAGYQYITNPHTKDSILQITGLDIADEDKGLFDRGSIEPIGQGSVMLLTYESGYLGWRAYNGYQYGPDQLEAATGRQRLPEIQNLKVTNAFYDGKAGMMLFGRE
jgi:hypothetical protein